MPVWTSVSSIAWARPRVPPRPARAMCLYPTRCLARIWPLPCGERRCGTNWRKRPQTAGERVEFEAKGGLAVAHDEKELETLFNLAESQRQLGARRVRHRWRFARAGACPTEDLSGGAFYEQDCQVQPMAAVDFLVRQFGTHGGCLVRGAEVVGAEHDRQGKVRSVRTTMGTVAVGTCVVNAAGPWAGEVARRLGTDIPVEPPPRPCASDRTGASFVRHGVHEAGTSAPSTTTAPAWPALR